MDMTASCRATAVVIGLMMWVASLPAETYAAACGPLPMPDGRIRVVRSAGQLEDAVRDARPNSTIVLEEGVYEISAMLELRA